MKDNGLLTITSLLLMLLLTFHQADDVVRGYSPGGMLNLVGSFILVVWLCATLLLAHRRSGLIILFVLSLLSAGVPVIHMRGVGMVGGRVANTSGAFFFVWTLIAIGAIAIFSAILSARQLWSGQRRQA